ncbi:divisome protein SepX/GlpR [Nocardioides pacificus]
MDLSAVIFVALAVAWAVYLVPKALKHHDEAVRTRSVDRFSHTMRVLARREPAGVQADQAATPGRVPSAPVVETVAVRPTPAQVKARREASRRATQRRRRVLGAVLALNLLAVGLSASALISWWYVALPAGLLVVWLVACRVMVKSERRPFVAPVVTHVAEVNEETGEIELVPTSFEVARNEQGFDEVAAEAETSISMAAATVDPTLWDPLPVTLPTYVTKAPAARRSVRTIDLDSTGVWSSGHAEGDSRIAREADEAAQAARSSRGGEAGRRAVGS